ncbi:MAG: HD domain-containing protein [Chloroflexi bacterium]|nr:HD domain-containing protein [Chloroflexota bacterium]
MVIILDDTYEDLLQHSLDAIAPLWVAYPRAEHMWELLVGDAEARANWDMADWLTTNKLAYNDHGMIHALIVGANAVLIYHLLRQAGVQPDIVTSGAGDADDACLAIVAAALLHDVGNQVHRTDHERVGVQLALPLLDRLMPRIYPETEKRVQIRAFILHAILSHDFDPPPLTFEAALVSIADGTDITKGRGRKAFDLGKVDIHSVSALAIDEVRIAPGADFPVEITVLMNNSAGIFQIEETLTRKVVKGPLARHVTVTALTRPGDGRAPGGDARIIERLQLRNGAFKTE